MFSNLVKMALLAVALVLVVIVVGNVTPTAADAPQAAPPTVVLPPPVATRTPPRVTPTGAAPKAPLRVVATPTKAPATTTRRGPRGLYTYAAGFQAQNLSTSQASIQIYYYNQDGTQASGSPFSDTISGSGSKTYYPIHPTGSFNGSVVISSDQALASIVNILGSGGAGAAASYDGSASGNTTVYAPLLMKNNSNINTWFNVQNAGTSSTSTNVSVTYSDGVTAGPVSVAAGAAKTFDQTTEAHATGWVGSGTVTSSGSVPIVVAVIEEDPSTMSAYSGFTSTGSTTPVMPLVNYQPSINIITGIQIMNTGSSSTDVTVTYTPAPPPVGAGTTCTETQTVPAGQSRTFALAAFAAGTNSTCTAGAKFVGSGQVTGNSASQTLNVIVNQVVPGLNAGAYNGFSPSAATNKTVMPLIMDRNSGIYTGFSVMNVGGSSTTVTCSFTGGVAYTANTPRTLAAGASFTEIQWGAIASGYVGSGTCTAANAGDKIVSVVNELGPGTGDQLLVYEGINQ